MRWRYENRATERQAILEEARTLEDAFEASFLRDPATGAKLLVLRDHDNRAVAGVETGPMSLELGPGQSVVLWAKFPAPSSGANAVTVYVPGAPPFEAVTIEP